jgi:hypothetical protein
MALIIEGVEGKKKRKKKRNQEPFHYSTHA